MSEQPIRVGDVVRVPLTVRRLVAAERMRRSAINRESAPPTAGGGGKTSAPLPDEKATVDSPNESSAHAIGVVKAIGEAGASAGDPMVEVDLGPGMPPVQEEGGATAAGSALGSALWVPLSKLAPLVVRNAQTGSSSVMNLPAPAENLLPADNNSFGTSNGDAESVNRQLDLGNASSEAGSVDLRAAKGRGGATSMMRLLGSHVDDSTPPTNHRLVVDQAMLRAVSWLHGTLSWHSYWRLTFFILLTLLLGIINVKGGVESWLDVVLVDSTSVDQGTPTCSSPPPSPAPFDTEGAWAQWRSSIFHEDTGFLAKFKDLLPAAAQSGGEEVAKELEASFNELTSGQKTLTSTRTATSEKQHAASATYEAKKAEFLAATDATKKDKKEMLSGQAKTDAKARVKELKAANTRLVDEVAAVDQQISQSAAKINAVDQYLKAYHAELSRQHGEKEALATESKLQGKRCAMDNKSSTRSVIGKTFPSLLRTILWLLFLSGSSSAVGMVRDKRRGLAQLLASLRHHANVIRFFLLSLFVTVVVSTQWRKDGNPATQQLLAAFTLGDLVAVNISLALLGAKFNGKGKKD